MGQGESKESEQNTHQGAQHVRRTIHGSDRSRRSTPPITNPRAQHQSGIRAQRTPGASRSQGQQRPTTTPRTFPRTRPLPNLRTHLTPSATEGAAQQRQTTSTVRSSRRLQQQFAVRPAQSPGLPGQSSNVPTPTRSLPIPINPPRSKAKPGPPAQLSGRPPSRRTAPLSKVTAQATDSDSETTEPPAKRVTRSRAALQTAEADSEAAGGSVALDQPLEGRPAAVADPPAEGGDVEPDDLDKTSAESESDGSSDDIDVASSAGEDELDDEEADELQLDEEEADQPGGTSVDSDSGASACERESRPASRDSGASFQLRRTRRRSIPVRRLQVDPQRLSYISV